MTDNPFHKAAKPLVVIDAAKAREWAAWARNMGYNDKAALWAKHAEHLAAEERQSRAA